MAHSSVGGSLGTTLIFNFRLRPLTSLNNQIDLPVTVFWDHNMIPGEAIIISGRPGNNAEESDNRFAKEKSISGNPKSIFAKIKNTFAKIKNTISFSGNRFSGNILQEAVNKLKEDKHVLPEAGNILQELKGFSKFSGNKLQEAESVLREAGNKLKEEEINLKILGEGMIFVETFRKFEIPRGNFLE